MRTEGCCLGFVAGAWSGEECFTGVRNSAVEVEMLVGMVELDLPG